MFDIQGIVKSIIEGVVKTDFLDQVQAKVAKFRVEQEWNVCWQTSSPGPGWEPFSVIDASLHSSQRLICWRKRIK